MKYNGEKEKYVSIQDFISFLKINKVYKKFRKNFSTPSKEGSFRIFHQNFAREDFFERNLDSNYDYLFFLSDAFEWEDTTEGWDFWYDVRSRFYEKYF